MREDEASRRASPEHLRSMPPASSPRYCLTSSYAASIAPDIATMLVASDATFAPLCACTSSSQA